MYQDSSNSVERPKIKLFIRYKAFFGTFWLQNTESHIKSAIEDMSRTDRAALQSLLHAVKWSPVDSKARPLTTTHQVQNSIGVVAAAADNDDREEEDL